MDLSWCIICDCHSVEENLYCSESCRMQDVNNKHKPIAQRPSPPSSPLLDPFFSSFNHDRRTSVTMNRSTTQRTSSIDNIFGYMSPSSVPRYSLSD